jgi:hypothetical protein
MDEVFQIENAEDGDWNKMKTGNSRGQKVLSKERLFTKRYPGMLHG